MHEYPKAKYHADGRYEVARDEEHERSFDADWQDAPHGAHLGAAAAVDKVASSGPVTADEVRQIVREELLAFASDYANGDAENETAEGEEPRKRRGRRPAAPTNEEN